MYDEADLGLEQTDDAVLEKLFVDDDEDGDGDGDRAYNRLTFLVGASVTESLGNLAVRSEVLPDGNSYIVTATKHAPLVSSSSSSPLSSKFKTDKSKLSVSTMNKQSGAASLQDLNLCMDPGLRHEYAIATGKDGLLSLTRMLRQELEEFEQSGANGQSKASKPRVVIFFPSEKDAADAIAPLRDALWGDHLVSVLLPETGYDPLRIMSDFKEGKTSVLMATPNSVRGLDFPALSSVYTLYLPVDDPREYIHLAGRVGRVGQDGSVKGNGGRVVSIVREEDSSELDRLATSLGVSFDKVDVPTDEKYKRVQDTEERPDVQTTDYYDNEDEDDDEDDEDDDEDFADDLGEFDLEAARRLLEDTMALVELVDDLDVDMDEVIKRESLMEDAIDADIEEDEGDGNEGDADKNNE